MKAKQLIPLILSVFLIMTSCSKDALDEPIMNNTDLNMDLRNTEIQTLENVKPIFMKGIGDIQYVKPNACGDLDQFDLHGQSKSEKYGLFKTEMINCTDHFDQNYLKGKHVTGKGEELWFYSDDFGVTKDGHWYIIYFYGGTGQFENVKGKMKIYMVEKFQDPAVGTYKFTGEGELYF